MGRGDFRTIGAKRRFCFSCRRRWPPRGAPKGPARASKRAPRRISKFAEKLPPRPQKIAILPCVFNDFAFWAAKNPAKNGSGRPGCRFSHVFFACRRPDPFFARFFRSFGGFGNDVSAFFPPQNPRHPTEIYG